MTNELLVGTVGIIICWLLVFGANKFWWSKYTDTEKWAIVRRIVNLTLYPLWTIAFFFISLVFYTLFIKT